jgi:uncharacterized protein
MDLPHFRFHPDPVTSGSIEASGRKCRCCDQARGWIYTGPAYSESDLDDAFCPWCIGDGSAHEKFEVTFVDSEAFDAGALPAVIDEIITRTPGFATFQGERWPSCCGEPGVFAGPAGIREIRQSFPRVESDLTGYVVHEMGVAGGAAKQLLESLRRDESPTAFVFRCGKCERHFGYIDLV